MRIEDEIRQQAFESVRQKAGINLLYTANWLEDRMSQVFKNFDVTAQQYNVLRILKGIYPAALSAGEIKAVMLDKNPDLTRLSDRLVAKGLIERAFNESNRRQVLAKISEKGLELLKAIEPVMRQESKSFNHLTEAESEQLSALLDRMRG